MAIVSGRLAADAASLAADAVELSTHTADPGETGANEGTATRAAVTCTSSGAVVTVPAASLTGGADGEAATWVGLWSAGGTFLARAENQTSGDLAYNAEGELDVGSWTVTYASTDPA